MKIVRGVKVLVHGTSSNHALHLYQVSQKYIERFQTYGADTTSILIITKGYNSVKIVYGVTVLVLCTSSNYAGHLYQVSQKYLEKYL